MQVPFPTVTDLVVLVIAYVYVIVVIGAGELLRRLRGYSAALTRKIIHLGAGFSAFTVPFYTHHWAALIVALSFVVLIFLASPKSPVKGLRTMFEVMAREEDYLSGHIWGPFLYAVSITILVAVFTLLPQLTRFFVLPATGLTAMYIGDGLAPIIGAKYGKHRYTVGKATRSVEGSIMVFVGSIAGALFCFLFLDWFAYGGIPQFNIWQAVILSLICACIATFIEAISPSGLDNITVPLITAAAVYGAAFLLAWI